jgi:hypothetical protein
MCNNTNKPTLDWGKPLQTMDGQDAKLVSDNFRTHDGPQRLVQIEFLNRSMSCTYDKYGNPQGCGNLGLTLRNKTRKVTKWYNLWVHNPGAQYYYDRLAAVHVGERDKSNHVATLSIEIEEPL